MSEHQLSNCTQKRHNCQAIVSTKCIQKLHGFWIQIVHRNHMVSISKLYTEITWFLYTICIQNHMVSVCKLCTDKPHEVISCLQNVHRNNPTPHFLDTISIQQPHKTSFIIFKICTEHNSPPHVLFSQCIHNSGAFDRTVFSVYNWN